MRLVIVAFVAAAVVVAPSATARPNERIAIRPGVGIGPLNLGMTGQEVRRALGKPRAVSKRRVLRDRPYVEFEWNYGDWWVGLVGPKGHRRVVLVGTALGRHRTREGLGVGTTEKRLWRELRGRIRERVCHNPSGLEIHHWYYRTGSGETIFFPDYPLQEGPPTVVGRVQVRSGPALGCNV